VVIYAVPHTDEFPLGTAAFICGAAFGDVPILGHVRYLRPPDWALYTVRSIVPLSERLDPSRLHIQPQ
jgi:hypothetical protein